MWKFIDRIIALPSYMIGYFVRANIDAFHRGANDYTENYRNYGA